MDAQYTLVRIYLFVCRHYRGRLSATVQRQSNNDEPDFTDEEVLTIYLFGLFKKRETISEIHEYAEDHFLGWFPNLPSYQSYNRRPDRLNPIFSPLLEKALEKIDCEEPREMMLRIADSMPTCVGEWTTSFSSEGRLRADSRRRLLLLERHLLPRREAPCHCRKAER